MKPSGALHIVCLVSKNTSNSYNTRSRVTLPQLLLNGYELVCDWVLFCKRLASYPPYSERFASVDKVWQQSKFETRPVFCFRTNQSMVDLLTNQQLALFKITCKLCMLRRGSLAFYQNVMSLEFL